MQNGVVIAAIITGVFTLLGVFLNDYLQRKRASKVTQSDNSNNDNTSGRVDNSQNRNDTKNEESGHLGYIFLFGLLLFVMLYLKLSQQIEPELSYGTEPELPYETETELPQQKELEQPICVFEDVDFSGKWTLTQTYTEGNQHPSIIWNELIVYHEINNFQQKNDYYTLDIHKYAENYKGELLEYLKLFKIQTLEGRLEDCILQIPIIDTMNTPDFAVYKGFLKFESYEEDETQKVMTGTFYHSYFETRGDIYAFSNKN